MQWKHLFWSNADLVRKIRSVKKEKREAFEKELLQRLTKELPVVELAIKLQFSENTIPIYKIAFSQLLNRLLDPINEVSSLKKEFLLAFDQQLILLIQRDTFPNRQQAENYLAERLQKYLHHQGFRKILSKKEDREEAFLSALLAFFQHLTKGSYRAYSTLETFFQGIYKNKCLNYLNRQRALKNKVADPWSGIAQEYLDLLDQQTQKNIRQKLSAIDQRMLKIDLLILKEKHPDCYELFDLHERYGFKYQEIADRKKIKLGAIKMRFKKCRDLLAQAAKALKIKE